MGSSTDGVVAANLLANHLENTKNDIIVVVAAYVIYAHRVFVIRVVLMKLYTRKKTFNVDFIQNVLGVDLGYFSHLPLYHTPIHYVTIYISRSYLIYLLKFISVTLTNCLKLYMPSLCFESYPMVYIDFKVFLYHMMYIIF
jgi:hypothetical protein